MNDPGEIDKFVETAHRHYDVLRERAAALSHRIEDGARHMADWKHRAPEGSPTSAGTMAVPITIDRVCAMIANALRNSGLTADQSVQIGLATLTTKVVKTYEESVGVKFAICGVRGGAGVQHASGNTQTVTIKFDSGQISPSSTGGNSNDPDSNGSEPDGSELNAELAELANLINLGAFAWKNASIDLDFTFDEQAKASIIAAGDIKDDSTHHLQVELTAKSTS